MNTNERSEDSGAKIRILFSPGKNILLLPQENTIHFFKPPCNVLSIIETKRHR